MTEQAKFTKGPWSSAQRSWQYTPVHKTFEIRQDRHLLASVYHADNCGDANARLIAASPDMYLALQLAGTFIDKGGSDEERNVVMATINKAFVKAEGGE